MGRRRYSTSVDISAPSGVVWGLIGDVESWPQWTPTMSSVRRLSDSHGVVGATYEITQPGIPRSVLVVDDWNDGRSFSWSARAGGVRTVADHVLTDLEPNRTQVTLSFDVQGPTAGLVWALAGRKIRRYVDTEAASLKTAAERGSA